MKGYHYLPKYKRGTKQAIESFERVFPSMGRIVRIIGTYSQKKHYRVKFYNDRGEVYDFYGFAWWYGGTGPSGLATCLRKMGIDEEIIRKLTDYSAKLHGDTFNPNSFFINLDRAVV